jgi:2-phosphoglycerate kinase
LARDLSCRLGIDHRIGTGFIRAVLQSESDPEVEPALFSLTFAAQDPIANLRLQAERLRTAVMACVQRARREGTSLIVEGSHLTPELYAREAVDLFVVLAAPSTSEHLTRLRGPTHANRAIGERDWHNVQKLNDYYVEEARRWDATTVVYGSQLDSIVASVESLSNQRPDGSGVNHQ